MLVVIAIADRRPPLDLVGPTSTASDATRPFEETVPTESAPPETVPPDTVASETPAAELSPTAIARDEFVDFVQGLPQAEIKPKEVRDLVKQIDEAIAASRAGETDKSIDKLTQVVEGLDKHIESEADREVASGLLAAVADSLGLNPDALFDEQD